MGRSSFGAVMAMDVYTVYTVCLIKEPLSKYTLGEMCFKWRCVWWYMCVCARTCVFACVWCMCACVWDDVCMEVCMGKI